MVTVAIMDLENDAYLWLFDQSAPNLAIMSDFDSEQIYDVENKKGHCCHIGFQEVAAISQPSDLS